MRDEQHLGDAFEGSGPGPMPPAILRAVVQRRRAIRTRRMLAGVGLAVPVVGLGLWFGAARLPADPGEQTLAIQDQPHLPGPTRFADTSVLSLRLADPDGNLAPSRAARAAAAYRPTAFELRRRELAGSGPPV